MLWSLKGHPVGHVIDALILSKKDCRDKKITTLEAYLPLLAERVEQQRSRPNFGNYILDEPVQKIIDCFEEKFFGDKTLKEKILGFFTHPFGNSSICEDWFPEIKP